jgi:MFS family permease
VLVLAAIPSHGVCYAFYFTVAYIYVDGHSSLENRAGAQQLFNILITGVGYLVGNLCAGKTAQLLTVSGTTQVDFARFWTVSAGLALIVAAVLVLLFREEEPVQAAGRRVEGMVAPDNP